MKYIIPVLLLIFGLVSILKPMAMVQMDRKLFLKKDRTDLETRLKVIRLTGVIAIIVSVISLFMKLK